MQIYLWQLLIGTRNWGNGTVYQDKDVLTLLFNALFLWDGIGYLLYQEEELRKEEKGKME